jgi:hypothetical protein
MFRQVMSSAIMAVMIVATVQGQAAAPAGKPASPQKPAPAEKPASGQKPAPAEAPVPLGQPVNIKLDLTITDQAGPGEPARKTITVIAADRSVGSIRTTGNSQLGGNRAIINVDATPQLLPNGNIRVMLGLEYNPRQPEERPGEQVKTAGGDVMNFGPTPGGSGLNQRVTIILEPGKPLVFSQAADPISDRKISVEVRAAVLK